MRMRFRSLLGYLAAVFQICQAADNSGSENATVVLTTLPPCAITCLAQALVQSTCSLTNPSCICGDKELNIATKTCVMANCTIKESLVTLNVTSTTCNELIRDKREAYKTLSITLDIVSTVFVLLRLYERWISDTEYGWDDWSIMFTSVIGIPSSIINVKGLTENGLGKDIWTVEPKMITDLIHYFFASELLYFTYIGTIKLSFLLFYLRIFPGTTIRKVIWATILVDILYTGIYIIVGVFQCRPISFYWKRWDGEPEGSCFDINAFAFANAAISILLDLWIIALPVTQIMHLKMHWKKRIGVAMMFSVGLFSTAVSIIRLRHMIVFSNTQNPTWDYLEVGYWSDIEVNTGIMCACMPNLRFLLMRAFPKIMGLTSSHSLSKNAGYGTELNNTKTNTRRSRTAKDRRPDAWVSSGIRETKGFEVAYGPQIEEGRESAVELVSVRATFDK